MTRLEHITEALMDLLAHARGCRHEEHREQDEKVCREVATRIYETVEEKIDSHENDSDFHGYKE